MLVNKENWYGIPQFSASQHVQIEILIKTNSKSRRRRGRGRRIYLINGMLQLKFRVFRSKIIKLFDCNLNVQKMSSTIAKRYSEVIVMSNIDGLADAVRSLCDQIYPKLHIVDTDVPDMSQVDELRANPMLKKCWDAEIAICEPITISCLPELMPKLKWVHCTWAGVEPMLATMNEKPNFIVTRHSHEDFSIQMAEYVMAHILILEKNYRNMWAAETAKSWSTMKSYSDMSWNRRINELTLGILGVGNMGQAIAKFFKGHGTKVIGLSRNERKPSEFGYFDNIEVSLNQVLTESDYIVNTLPSTPETIGLLNGNVLEVCRDKAPVFINVGRGNIILEEHLLKALKNKWLRHAVLDVFENEEEMKIHFVPEMREIWKSNQVTITPHCAAVSLPNVIAKDFLNSFKRFQQNRPMLNVVDWDRGY